MEISCSPDDRELTRDPLPRHPPPGTWTLTFLLLKRWRAVRRLERIFALPVTSIPNV